MQLAIGIAIGAFVGILAVVMAVIILGWDYRDKELDRQLAQDRRHAYFIGMVSTELVHKTHLMMQASALLPDSTLVYALACALDPACLPGNMLEGACDFVEMALEGKEPSWVRYMGAG